MTLTSNDILTAVTPTAFLQTGLDVLNMNDVEEDGRVSVFTAEIRAELEVSSLLAWVLLMSGSKTEIIVNTNIMDFHHQQKTRLSPRLSNLKQKQIPTSEIRKIIFPSQYITMTANLNKSVKRKRKKYNFC